MRSLRSISILRNSIIFSRKGFILGVILLSLLATGQAWGRIYLDINAPSIQRIKIAIPDFHPLSGAGAQPELASLMPAVVSNDLELSGYFRSIEKEAFLVKGAYNVPEEINLRDWAVIGADLLLYVRYNVAGSALEAEVRLYDIFTGRRIVAKRLLGRVGEYRRLMHRVSNEILFALTSQEGMYLSELAFVGTASGHKEIYTCDLDGENVRRLTSDDSIALFPRWSPKRDMLLFNSFKEGEARLYLRNQKTGRVKRVSGRQGLNLGASWAPDGKSLALTLSHGKNPDIYRIDLEGNVLKQLTNHFAIDVSPSFSPDGKEIAYVSSRSGCPQIYVRELGTGKDRRITFEGNYNTSPNWSRTGRIAFSGMRDGSLDIYAIDPDGRNLRKLTDSNGKNEDPCWAPDGRYIVFSSNRTGRYHLYLMNANGQNQQRLTAFSGEQTSPSWSSY